MPRSSPKFSHEPVNAYFYDAWSTQGEDEHAGIEDQFQYAIFRFPKGETPENLDEYNAKQSAFEDQVNASEIVMLCTEMVGAIVRESNDGFVDADLYTNTESLEREWQSILDDTMLEQCDECQQESDEYGKGMPIAHLDSCSQP